MTSYKKDATEQEMIQQILYNTVLYLPLKQLGVKDEYTIREIVRAARTSYDGGNRFNIDLHDLELLEACLDEKSGISDIGEARMYYASFNKDVNELVARGVDRKQAEGIVNPEVLVTVVFVYDGSEKQGLKRNLCFTFRELRAGRGLTMPTWKAVARARFNKTDMYLNRFPR